MLEDIESWLKNAYGEGNLLLSYVTREYANPDENPRTDPGFLNPSIRSKLIRQTTHSDSDFDVNNGKVWLMIRATTQKTYARSIVKSHARAEDGRSAYFALVNHYRGTGHVNHIIMEAKSVIDTLF